VEDEIDGRGSGGKQIARRVGRIRNASANQPYGAALVSSTGSRESIMNKLRVIAIELGLAPRLALSMAKVESGYDPRAVSPKGAIGVLQLIPFFVCQEYEVSPEMLFDPEVNIRIGLSYMKSLLERFDENLDLSLAAYNAGASRVVEAGYNIPPIEETQKYVKRVKEAMR
jgi:soluble lytic murein transglycosylase-like protein